MPMLAILCVCENHEKTIWSGDVGKSVSLEVNIG